VPLPVPLASNPAVKSVSSHLPTNRTGEFYVPIDQIVTTGLTYAKQFGAPLNVTIQPDLPPLGVASSTDGSALRFDAYVPTLQVGGQVVTFFSQHRNQPIASPVLFQKMGEAFRQAIASYEQRVENVPRREEELATLSRDSATTKDRYDSLLKRYEEAQLASSLEQGQKVEQFRILDAAIPPREPTAPSRTRLFAIGFCLAIGLAIGSVLLVEKLDTAFHNIDDLRAFVAVPTLFSIPRILTTAEARRRWRRAALTAVSVVIGLALVITGSRYLASDNEQLVRLTASTRG